MNHVKCNLVRGLRIIILLGLLFYVTYEGYMHQVLGGGKAPSVHALCPFGALESLYTFGRSFCGVLCPFSALQELFGKIGRKVFKKQFIIPAYIDKPLHYLKIFYIFFNCRNGLAIWGALDGSICPIFRIFLSKPVKDIESVSPGYDFESIKESLR